MTAGVSIQLNVRNFEKIWAEPPAEYAVIRFDLNDDCNLHCVYCHVPRSTEVIGLEAFHSFLHEKVLSVRHFQVGCGMEPTLDPRLCDFMEAIGSCPAPPREGIRLQTNGLLLHRHDAARMRAAGLAALTVSIDSASSVTHRSLRGGASLAKIQRNVVGFRRACPQVAVWLITTVTAENIDEVDDLLSWGLDEGVHGFELRQMFYYPTSPIVDHQRMRRLQVTDEQFAAMRERIETRFGGKARLLIQGNDQLMRRARKIRVDSQLPHRG